MTLREIGIVGAGAAAAFVAVVAAVLLGLEPLIRATGHSFGVVVEDQPVVLTEDAVLFQDERPIAELAPGLIASRSTSREKFDDYEVIIGVGKDLFPKFRRADRLPPFVTARPGSRLSAGGK